MAFVVNKEFKVFAPPCLPSILKTWAIRKHF